MKCYITINKLTILSVYITANLYCKSRKLPNTDARFLGRSLLVRSYTTPQLQYRYEVISEAPSRSHFVGGFVGQKIRSPNISGSKPQVSRICINCLEWPISLSLPLFSMAVKPHYYGHYKYNL